VAKVMVSIPDDLLERLDEQARRRGTTRSGLLRRLVETELASTDEARRLAIADVLAAARPHGGATARLVRELRRAR
jgi:metal-responsive CopG/Arc/MetJ family transcriptional regulator